MVFGMNDDDKKSKDAKAVKADDKKSDAAADAAAELKKMQEKEDSGDCAFC